MKNLLIFVIVVLLYSCKKPAQETTTIAGYEIEFLFEKDGCKMYRFNDNGRFIYWSNCNGKTERNYTTHSGKTTQSHHDETITTK